MGKFSYEVYESVGYHAQTYGHELMIDDLITKLGVEGARKHVNSLRSGNSTSKKQKQAKKEE